MGCTPSSVADSGRPLNSSKGSGSRQADDCTVSTAEVKQEVNVLTTAETECSRQRAKETTGSPLVHSTVSFEAPADCQGAPEPSLSNPNPNPPHPSPILLWQTSTPSMSFTSPTAVPNPLAPSAFSLPNTSFTVEREWPTQSQSDQLQSSKNRFGHSAVSPASAHLEGGRLSRTTLTAAGVSKQSGSHFAGSGLTGELDWLELHSLGRSSPGFSASEPDDPRWWEPQVRTRTGTKRICESVRCRQPAPGPSDSGLPQNRRIVTVKQLISW